MKEKDMDVLYESCYCSNCGAQWWANEREGIVCPNCSAPLSQDNVTTKNEIEIKQDKLQAKVNKLEAERDELQQRVDKLECKVAYSYPDMGYPQESIISILHNAANSDAPTEYLFDIFNANPELISDQSRVYNALAEMIEYNFVMRESYDDLVEEFVWTYTFLHRTGKHCGFKDVHSLKAYIEKLETERNELKKKIEIIRNQI